MIGTRGTALVLVLLASAAGVSACGDSRRPQSSGTHRTTPARARSDVAANADEYPGVFASAKEVCGSVPRRRVAANVRSRSTRPKAIARAFANGYKPRLQAHAYRGCLAGLR
jgi:hypothetical protein